MINTALSSWIPCFGLSDLASSLGQLHILDLFFIGLLITSQMQAILLWSCSSLDKYFPNGCELLLVCNIFHFRIFRFYVIILTIYHFILILFIFNIHTVKISTDQKKKSFHGHCLSSDDGKDDHHCSFCIDISEYKWFILMHQLMSFFVLTSSEVRYIVSHMLLIHPPQQLHWLPRSLSFLSCYCLALWRAASSCASCSTSDDTQSVALYSHSSLPWSPEVESNCGFWQLSKWRSLNLWPEGTLHCDLELLMFIAELTVWIIHRPQFLERCPLFFSHSLMFCWSDTIHIC